MASSFWVMSHKMKATSLHDYIAVGLDVKHQLQQTTPKYIFQKHTNSVVLMQRGAPCMCFFGHPVCTIFVSFTSLQFELYYCIKVICPDYWQKYVGAWIAYLITNILVTAAVQFQIRVNACGRSFHGNLF